MSCDFERGFHSAWEARGHFSRRPFPCLRLSALDNAAVVLHFHFPFSSSLSISLVTALRTRASWSPE